VALFTRTFGVKPWLTAASIANFTRIYAAGDTGVRDIAVVDECVYIARQYKGYLSILARKRPW